MIVQCTSVIRPWIVGLKSNRRAASVALLAVQCTGGPPLPQLGPPLQSPPACPQAGVAMQTNTATSNIDSRATTSLRRLKTDASSGGRGRSESARLVARPTSVKQSDDRTPRPQARSQPISPNPNPRADCCASGHAIFERCRHPRLRHAGTAVRSNRLVTPTPAPSEFAENRLGENPRISRAGFG
jgi:hypothetical protein